MKSSRKDEDRDYSRYLEQWREELLTVSGYKSSSPTDSGGNEAPTTNGSDHHHDHRFEAIVPNYHHSELNITHHEAHEADKVEEEILSEQPELSSQAKITC
ncbi:MAG TPA: hypothetical protein PLD88_11875 [Candidatus Berkiella sp.]|nr:hypothetical protein [Candidatus Berkiella sp.]